MNQEQIKKLEKELWDAADGLRSNSKLTAAEYKDPLLGLVLLRFAQNRFEDAKIQVANSLPVNPRTGKKREANKDDYAAAVSLELERSPSAASQSSFSNFLICSWFIVYYVL